MGATIKGITITIDGDTTKLGKALDGVNKQSRDIQSELKQVERLLKLDPGNTELVAQKQKLLAEAVGNTKSKLETLREAQKQVQQQFERGEIGADQYRALQREVIATEQSLERLETQTIQSNAALSRDEAVGNLKNMALAAGAAAATIGVAFAGMANAALESADELQRQADVTGLTAERLQELQYAGNNLGVSLDTVTGAQAKLTKAMFAAKDGTGTQADAFAALGINVLDVNGQLRDAKTVMEEAFTALNGVGNETERDALSMQLFGKSAMEMNPMIKAGGDELKRLSDEARNNGAVMSNEAVAGTDTFGDTMDNLKNSILGSFGEKFAEILPKLQEFLDKLKELPQWIQDNSTKLEIIGITIGTVTALIIAFNIQQALLASGMTLWTAVAGVATAVTTALGTAMAFLTSPIGLIILAIGALIAIGVLLYKNWDEITEFLAKAWNTIKKNVSSIWGSIIQFFQELPGKIMTFFDELPGKLGYAIGLALGTLIKFGIDAVQWAITEVPKIITNIMTFFSTLPGKIGEQFTKTLSNLITWAGNMTSSVITEVPKIIDKIMEFFSELPGKMVEVGVNVVKGLWEGIKSMADWLGSLIKNFIKGLITGTKDALDEHSPSKVFMEIGKNVSLGMGIGIESGFSKVNTAMRKLNGVTIGGISGAESSGSTSRSYTFAPGSIVIPARDIAEMKTISDFFKRLPQVARQGV